MGSEKEDTSRDWERLPGLYKRREFERVVKPARSGDVRAYDYYFEASGDHSQGGEGLYIIYLRPHRAED